MAPLKNSQRIAYKATYSQAAPTAAPAAGQTAAQGSGQPRGPSTGKVAGGAAASAQSPASPTKLMRAVEKTAFLQSLQIDPSELAKIQKTLSDAPRAQAQVMTQALAAVGKLIADDTATSTLNNASLFANIDIAILLQIADALIALRTQAAAVITRTVADIVTAYRAAIAAPAASPGGGPAPPQTPASPGAQTRQTTSRTGLPVTLVETPIAAPGGPKNPNMQLVGSSAQIALDTSKTTPARFAAPPMTPPTQHAPSNNAALAWAETAQPLVFDALLKALQPYAGLSGEQQLLLGRPTAAIKGLKAGFNGLLNIKGLKGAVAGLQTRWTIEPVGNLHLERIEMYPAGIERGELVASVPLAPGETVNISHKEWSISEREFEDIVQDSLEGYSEQGVAEKSDVAMATDSQSQHATALNVGASLSASYSSVTLSTNVGYNATTNDAQSRKDSRTHAMTLTKKASARTKKDHKVTFKVTSVTGSEDQAVRVISNPSTTDAMRIDYFQLARKWKVELLRYGLRMTYDIAIPNPGSALMTLAKEVEKLNKLINAPFSFDLPLASVLYNPYAVAPQAVSNYDLLAAEYGASVTPPPEPQKWVNAHKETEEVEKYGDVHFDSLEFVVEESYYIESAMVESTQQIKSGETHNYFTMLSGESINQGIANLGGASGQLSIDFVYQYVYNYGLNVTLSCRPKPETVADWRLQAWNQMRSAAEDAYEKNLQGYKDRQAQLIAQIAEFDALTLRRMEQEEIMKGVLRWLFGPQFYLVPDNIATHFGKDSNDLEVSDVLDPNSMSMTEWQNVMTNGEFIKYVHNAIEWENVLYFTYPYFWDDQALWDFKKFLFHPDSTHRAFLRAGAARVVLTIRPGFEASFTQLVESGAFQTLPGAHPYVTIAQEMQDYASTNYPGFPPANPDQEARPLLYLEQRRVWTQMQYVIKLLNAFKADKGVFPPQDAGDSVPAAALTPYLDGQITIDGTNYNGVNGYNADANAKQLALDPTTPAEALLPTYTAVPVEDIAWGNPYFYKCPGGVGDYDLICYGADGAVGGDDKNADISANSEASLIATWFKYTPTGAMDIGITTNPPNVVPPEPDPQIA